MLNTPHNTQRFFVAFPSGETMELEDAGGLSGARRHDGLYSAKTTLSAAGSQQIQLIAQGQDGRTQDVWAGTVTPLSVREDAIAFRMDETGTVAPMLMSMDMDPTGVEHKGAQVLGLAWLLAVAMMGLWWRQTRREESEE